MSRILRHSDSPSGKHRCVVEADTSSVWMYLHDLATSQIIGDAPLCSLAPLAAQKDFAHDYHGMTAPPLVKGHFLEQAVIPDLTETQIAFTWDDDDSVTVAINALPTSRIEQGKKKGFSIYITEDGPWGSPWKK